MFRLNLSGNMKILSAMTAFSATLAVLKAENYHLNVIIVGHLTSDSLGMNIILDEFEAKRGADYPLLGA